MIDINPKILQSIWAKMMPKLPPQAHQVMNDMMDRAKSGMTPALAINTMFQVAESKGIDTSRVKDNVILNSFKQKNADEVIPHAVSTAKEIGVINLILGAIGLGGKK